ncbi:hypothetical protein D5045_08820 [Verminephrobacter eiseniae]|nr:hypothetical protein [Verminephrobacter eiseniae]
MLGNSIALNTPKDNLTSFETGFSWFLFRAVLGEFQRAVANRPLRHPHSLNVSPIQSMGAYRYSQVGTQVGARHVTKFADMYSTLLNANYFEGTVLLCLTNPENNETSIGVMECQQVPYEFCVLKVPIGQLLLEI